MIVANNNFYDMIFNQTYIQLHSAFDPNQVIFSDNYK